MHKLDEQIGKPVWEVKIRPIGEPHVPWETTRMHAASILQAEAILRRRGYELATHSAVLVDGDPTVLPGDLLKPIVCTKCGYSLSGLTIDRTSVICTECAHVQPLVVYKPEKNAEIIDRNHPIIGIFAVIGILTTIILTILVVIPVFFALLF